MKQLILTCLILISFLSCKKKETVTETSVATGSISGKISQFNQYGEKLNTGLNNVSISLDNDVVTAKTDDQGNYTLSNVKPGIYTIFYSKPGCITNQVQQVNFPGNGTLLKDAELVETPTTELLSATLKFADTGVSIHNLPRLNINIKLKPVSKPVWFTIVFGSNDAIDFDKIGTFYTYRSYQIPANTNDFNYSASVNDTSQKFARIYPFSGHSSTYHDYNSKTNINLGYGKPLPAQKIE